jgi:hypothetical protein
VRTASTAAEPRPRVVGRSPATIPLKGARPQRPVGAERARDIHCPFHENTAGRIMSGSGVADARDGSGVGRCLGRSHSDL